MAVPVALLFSLDIVAAIFMAAIAVFFFRIWRDSRDGLHLLYSIGMALIGIGYVTVTASAYELGNADVFDRLRIAAQMGGALVIMFAYVAVRDIGHGKPWIVLAWTAAASSYFFLAVFALIPPVFEWKPREIDLALANLALAPIWTVTAVLSAQGALKTNLPRRLFVPAAFFCFAVSKYTWFIIALVDQQNLAIVVYPWRFAAITLLVLALFPQKSKEVAIPAAT